MPLFLNHNERQKHQQISSSYQQVDNQIEGNKIFNIDLPQNQNDSSPSFCTEQHHEFGLQIEDSFILTSQQSSVSQFGQVFCDFLATDNFQDFQHNNAKSHDKPKKIIELYQENSYTPTLQSYESYDPSVEIVSSKKYENDTENNLKFSKSKNFDSSMTFVPDIKSLTDHVTFLEEQLFLKEKQYLKIKNFCQAVIISVKNLLSNQIGTELQKYMKKHFNLPQMTESDQFQHENALRNYSSKLSKEFISKLSSQSLSYSIDLNSKQLSKSIQEIFTLGSSKFVFNKDQSLKLKQREMNSKSTEKKAKNFKKNKFEKENIPHQVQLQSKKEIVPHNIRQSKRPSQICVKNESMKFLMNDYASTQNSSISTPRSLLNYQTPAIATQLLCQVCSRCFLPNQFFKHLPKCSTSHESSISSLKSTQKLTFNYTRMMEKLFDMRQEIESQIELLQKSKQKSEQRSERQKLRKKLEEDLQKVTKIIEEKQKQMEIHLSKNIQCRLLKINR